MDNIMSNGAGKAPMTDAERQAKRRQRLKQLQEGCLAKTIFEEAKEAVKAMADPSIEQLFTEKKYQEGLSNDEVKSLHIFVKNLKQKLKQEKKLTEQSKISELTIKEKVKKIANQEFAELQKSLTIPHSQKERQDLILSKVDENLFLFLDYMEQHEPPYSDFLKDIVETHSKVQNEVFTKLFANVCSLYGGQELTVTSGMCEAAMIHLTNGLPNIQAAFGLLRLIFQNDIHLNGYSKDLLLNFQVRYEQTIASFLKTVTKVKRTVIGLLPPTIFTFTPPLLKCLREGADELHRQVPLDFLPMLIDIVCYSFNKDFAEFQTFLQVFKDGCMKHIEYLRETEFQNLLQAISEQVQKRSKIYFGGLESATDAIRKAFLLVSEGKIVRFDEELVSNLTEGGATAFQMIKQQPKIIVGEGIRGIQKLAQLLEHQNKALKFTSDTLQLELCEEDLVPFKALKIHNLLDIQHLTYSYCKSCGPSAKTFIQYSTGQGKTALCFGLAYTLAKQGMSVVILNESTDLTFRDFKKAIELQEILGLNIQLLEVGSPFQIDQFNITFTCVTEICSDLIYQGLLNSNNTCLIMDEFDSIVFSDSISRERIFNLINTLQFVLGFTGSDLQPYHKNFIQRTLNSTTLNFIVNNNQDTQLTFQECIVLQNLREHRNYLTKLAVQQCETSPVIIIVTEGAENIQLLIQKKGVASINIATQKTDYVEASLRVFQEKQNNKYSVFIINESQGRGLDFPSNKEIEENGGVYLIIASLPKTFLQFRQYLGRTARIGNKGIYSVCLLDKEAKHIEGRAYLAQKLEQLKNIDIIKLQTTLGKIAQQAIEGEKSPINEQQQEAAFPCEKLSMDQEITETEELYKSESESIGVEQLKKRPRTISSKEAIHEEEKEFAAQIELKPDGIDQQRKNKFEQKAQARINKRVTKEYSLKDQIDRLYFEGYCDPKIHKEMLSDLVRHEAYERAIRKICKDKIVLDVGAGSGFLSILAAQNGASHVYGVENSDYISKAIKQVKTKKLSSIITLVKGLAEEVELPIKSVDLIVSEWMGYFLICEHMLSSVIIMRKKFLHPEGEIIPREGSIYIAAYLQEESKQEYQRINDDGKEILEAVISQCNQDWISSEFCKIFHMDFKTEELEDNSFKSEFEFVITKPGPIDGIVCWFDVDMAEGIRLTTSPKAPLTHWQQVLLRMDRGSHYKSGDILSGTLEVRPQQENYRALIIELNIIPPGSKIEANYIFSLL